MLYDILRLIGHVIRIGALRPYEMNEIKDNMTFVPQKEMEY